LSAVSTYAEALFGAARERDELEETRDNLQEFVEALGENEELRLFYHGGQIPEQQKRQALDGLTDGMTTSTRNFLKVLIDNDRTEIVDEVLIRFEELVKEHLGRVEVELTTAVELSSEALNRVKYRLGKVLDGKDVVLETKVDPELIGGAVFRFGGQRLDGSVRGQLQTLRERMLERGVV
jgi:F-type H+-transporting ATPase subunit delta